MIDESHFVTGSDNGNVALWSLAKKKPLTTKRLSHGLQPQFTPIQAVQNQMKNWLYNKF